VYISFVRLTAWPSRLRVFVSGNDERPHHPRRGGDDEGAGGAGGATTTAG
jgi:hypothetical protein